MADGQTPHKTKRTRSPAYPFIPLSKALERAKAFYDIEKRHPAPFSVAVQHWDFKPKSSGGFQTVAALKQYGLMQDIGSAKERQVRLTDLALKILLDQREESGERAQAIKTAALKPTIHSDIWSKWGLDLPSDATVRTYLILTRKFNEDSADDVIKVYKDTIGLANLAETDTVSSDQEDITDTRDSEDRQVQAEEQISTRSAPPKPLILPMSGETERLRLPLSGGRAVRLLFTGPLPTQSDIDKLIALLELSKDSFAKSDDDSAA